MKLMKKRLTEGRMVSLIVAIALIIDQAIKLSVKLGMRLYESIHITDWFYIYFTENPGMAFGMEIFGKLFLTLFRIVAVACFVYYVYKIRGKGFPRGYLVCVALIIAGAAGNIPNTQYYLYNKKIEGNYLTTSSYSINSQNGVTMINIMSNGALGDGILIGETSYIRPVINIGTNAKIKGKGTFDNPYIIVS